MRVGLLTTSFPRTAHDVAGNFVLGFARALVSQGHTIEALVPEPKEALSPLAIDGIDITHVRYLPRAIERTFYGAGVLDNLKHDPLAWLGLLPFSVALAQAARSRIAAWDAVVSHWAVPCALAAASARRHQRHLAVLHSGDVFLLEKARSLGLATLVARGSDVLLFVSRDLRARFMRLLNPIERIDANSKAHVCAMGIEPQQAPNEARAELRARLGLEKLTVLSVGRLVSIKGLGYAIDAVAAMTDAELVIVGEGPERDALEQHARAKNAPVRFVGAAFGAEKQAWFAASDLFVVPSLSLASGRTEGMPTTLLEAMAHGLVPVVSDTGGIGDVVRHRENGLLVPERNSDALRRGLSSLREPSARTKLSREAKKTGVSYTWPALAPNLAALLQDDA
jgi:glycosyltransferase involved in cell wall biosynthesis